MNLIALLNDKELKRNAKCNVLTLAFINHEITVSEITPHLTGLDSSHIGLVLQAMEAVSLKTPEIATVEWVEIAKSYITAENNTLKREASRIAGNLAHLYPEETKACIPLLLQNTTNESTVVRWGSGYAFAKIIAIPAFATSPLYQTVTEIAEKEQDSGVKNQYLKGLKRAGKLRL